MSFNDDDELRRIVYAREDFDRTNRERGLSLVSQFAWAKPGSGMLAQAFNGSVNDYSDGTLAHQKQFQHTQFHGGGPSNFALNALQLRRNAAIKNGTLRIHPAKPWTGPMPIRRRYKPIPGSGIEQGSGGASSGLFGLSQIARNTFIGRLDDKQAEIERYGWGPPIGEGAGDIAPPDQPGLDVGIRYAPPRGQPAPGIPAPPPLSVEEQEINAKLTTLREQLQHNDTAAMLSVRDVARIGLGAGAFGRATKSMLTQWREALLAAKKAITDANNPAGTLIDTLAEACRLQIVFIDHNLTAARRQTLDKAWASLLPTLAPGANAAAALASAAKSVAGAPEDASNEGTFDDGNSSYQTGAVHDHPDVAEGDDSSQFSEDSLGNPPPPGTPGITMATPQAPSTAAMATPQDVNASLNRRVNYEQNQHQLNTEVMQLQQNFDTTRKLLSKNNQMALDDDWTVARRQLNQTKDIEAYRDRLIQLTQAAEHMKHSDDDEDDDDDDDEEENDEDNDEFDEHFVPTIPSTAPSSAKRSMNSDPSGQQTPRHQLDFSTSSTPEQHVTPQQSITPGNRLEHEAEQVRNEIMHIVLDLRRNHHEASAEGIYDALDQDTSNFTNHRSTLEVYVYKLNDLLERARRTQSLLGQSVWQQ